LFETLSTKHGRFVPDVLSVPVAAAEKRCSRQTIYNALDRGALNELRTGKTRLVLRDEAYDEFEVKRKHDPYPERRSSSAE